MLGLDFGLVVCKYCDGCCRHGHGSCVSTAMVVADMVTVRRTLFDGAKSKLERRQSVAVMQSCHLRTPKKKAAVMKLLKSPKGSTLISVIFLGATWINRG
jgi:hypothetical protein